MIPFGHALRGSRFDMTDLAADLDEAERLGVDLVELPLLSLPVIAGARPIPAQAARLQALVAGRSFGTTIHGPIGFNLMDPEPARLPLHEAVAVACLELAGRLGSRHLVLHTGMVAAATPADLRARLADQEIERYRRLGAVAADNGVTICVENVFPFGGHESALPSELARRLAAIGHPNVRATLDVSHAALNTDHHGADLVTEVAALAPYVKQFHVHDSFGRMRTLWFYAEAEALAYGQGDLHLPPGWGAIPFDAVMAAGPYPADAVAILELDPAWWSALPEALAATRDLVAARVG